MGMLNIVHDAIEITCSFSKFISLHINEYGGRASINYDRMAFQLIWTPWNLYQISLARLLSNRR